MRTKQQIILDQLDDKLLLFKAVSALDPPQKGWIHLIRTSLRMTLDQFGRKLKMSKQGVKKIEEREENGSISINLLKEAGKALDMKFVYGFVPIDGSIKQLVDKQAKALAKTIVLRTNQNMKLEDQGIGESKIEKSIQEMTEIIKREMRRSIWD